MLDGPGAPYLIVAPSGPALPVVLSSPHSGQCYPPAVLAQSRLTSEELRALDDGPVDELLVCGCAAGATLIAATYPRAVVDLNRDDCEQDPDSLEDPAAIAGLRATVKARAGLGVVPTRLLGEPIYAGRLSSAELQRRIAGAYRPYHQQLAALVADHRRRFGVSLVLDCHSMPTLPAPARGERAIDVALGDRFGRSCHPRLIEAAERLLAAGGLRVARNRPVCRRPHHRALRRAGQGQSRPADRAAPASVHGRAHPCPQPGLRPPAGTDGRTGPGPRRHGSDTPRQSPVAACRRAARARLKVGLTGPAAGSLPRNRDGSGCALGPGVGGDAGSLASRHG